LPSDAFGFIQYYPSKSGGESYTLPDNLDSKKGTSGTYDKGRIRIGGQGGTFSQDGDLYKLSQNEQVRIGICTSAGYDAGNIETDRDTLADRGYMMSPKDWHNVEVTLEAEYNGGGPSDEELTLYCGGGVHSDSKKCEGFAYKGFVEYNGNRAGFNKEEYHGSDNFRYKSISVGSWNNKTRQIKFVRYDVDKDGHPTITQSEAKSVKLELYFAKDGDGKFVKVFETTDTGNWTNGASACGGSVDGQVAIWGGPLVTIRWDAGAKISMGKLTVREIDATKNFDQQPPGSETPPAQDGGTPDPTPVTPTVDDNGIQWLVARGDISTIKQSRNNPGDHRWSKNYKGVKKFGFEATIIAKFHGVTPGTGGSSGHVALKHWGPNHSSPCGHSEGGSCCCWYDIGLRANGDLQLQIERPHPHNKDFTHSGTKLTNLGQGMNENTIGFKWVVFPVKPNGSADNGGIHLMGWGSKDALQNGKPRNNWVLMYDFIDNGEILGNYDAPDEQEIEMRNSDTKSADVYAGGLQVRLLEDGDATRPPDTGGGGAGGGGGGETPPPDTGGGTGQISRVFNSWDLVYDNIVDTSGFTCSGGAPPGGSSYTSFKSVTTITDDKQLGVNNSGEDGRTRVGDYVATTSSDYYQKKPTKIEFYLKKFGTPAGSFSVDVYDNGANGGTLKGTYGSMLASSLTTSYVLYSFINDNAGSFMANGMQVGWYVCVRYEDASGNSSNGISVGVNYNDPFDGHDTHDVQWQKNPSSYELVKYTARDVCGKSYKSP